MKIVIGLVVASLFSFVVSANQELGERAGLSTKLTIKNTLKEDGFSEVTTKVYEVSDKKTLRSLKLKRLVDATAAKAISLSWDEGSREFEKITDESLDQYHIKEMLIENEVVTSITVIINGSYNSFEGGLSHNGTFKCEVDLLRYVVDQNEEMFADYALCTLDTGEEQEYEE